MARTCESNGNGEELYLINDTVRKVEIKMRIGEVQDRCKLWIKIVYNSVDRRTRKNSAFKAPCFHEAYHFKVYTTASKGWMRNKVYLQKPKYFDKNFEGSCDREQCKQNSSSWKGTQFWQVIGIVILKWQVFFTLKVPLVWETEKVPKKSRSTNNNAILSAPALTGSTGKYMGEIILFLNMKRAKNQGKTSYWTLCKHKEINGRKFPWVSNHKKRSQWGYISLK